MQKSSFNLNMFIHIKRIKPYIIQRRTTIMPCSSQQQPEETKVAGMLRQVSHYLPERSRSKNAAFRNLLTRKSKSNETAEY